MYTCTFTLTVYKSHCKVVFQYANIAILIQYDNVINQTCCLIRLLSDEFNPISRQRPTNPLVCISLHSSIAIDNGCEHNSHRTQ